MKFNLLTFIFYGVTFGHFFLIVDIQIENYILFLISILIFWGNEMSKNSIFHENLNLIQLKFYYNCMLKFL